MAAFEVASSLPTACMATGTRRLGYDANATLFFDEHVEADAVHEQIAGRDMAGALAAESRRSPGRPLRRRGRHALEASSPAA